MNVPPQSISFKDTAGFVRLQEDGYYRYISYEYAKEFEHFVQSGLYQSLVKNNLLIPHEEIKNDAEKNGYYRSSFPNKFLL